MLYLDSVYPWNVWVTYTASCIIYYQNEIFIRLYTIKESMIHGVVENEHHSWTPLQEYVDIVDNDVLLVIEK